MKIITLSFLPFLLIFSTLEAQNSAGIKVHADEIFAEWNNDQTPGGVVAVFEKGKIVFSKAYGLANLEYEVPNTTGTIFNIASVSKQFTAFSMVLLEQQGKLSLDDDIRKHLPELPDFGEKITIRHMLNHISGLRNFQDMLAMAGWRRGESMTNEDLLRFMVNQKELNFPVGSQYLYCNAGFNLCTHILERITGQTWQEWTKANIFDPLGMEDTNFREDLTKILKNTAASYTGNEKNGFIRPLPYWTYMGNGNVYTTVEDLGKWLDNFKNPKVGGKAAIDRLQENGVLTSGKKINYALGINNMEYRGQRMLRHGGSVGGYRSNMMYFPDLEVGIIVLSNFSGANAGGKAQAMAEAYLGDQLEPVVRRMPEAPKAVQISNAAFDKLVGEYDVDGIRVVIARRGNSFRAMAAELNIDFELQAASETTFFVENTDVRLNFTLGKNGKAEQVFTIMNGERNRGYRIDKAMQNKEVLKMLTGTYYSPELDARYTFMLKDGKLIGHHQRHGEFSITPLTKNLLQSELSFFSRIEVAYENAEVDGIRVSSGRVKNMWFEKID